MIGLVIAAASAILQGVSAVEGASAANKAAKANKTAANAAFTETDRALGLRLDQEAQANAQAVHELSRDTTATRGALAANAGAAGVEGNTVDALDAGVLAQDFANRDILARNFAMTEQNIQQARREAIATRDSRINGVQGANPVATGLGLGNSLLAFGYDWMKMHPPTNTPVKPVA